MTHHDTSDDAPTTTDLETRVEELERRNERLETIIAAIARDDDGLPDISPDASGGLSRRATLGLLAAAGVGLGGTVLATKEDGLYRLVDPAAAEEGIGQGSIGSEDDPLEEVFVENLIETYVTELLQADEIQLDGPHSETTIVDPDDDDLNLEEANIFEINQSGSLDLSFANTGHAHPSQPVLVVIYGNGSSVSWPSEVDWGDQDQPEDPADGEELHVTLWTVDDGSTFKGAEAWREGS